MSFFLFKLICRKRSDHSKNDPSFFSGVPLTHRMDFGFWLWMCFLELSSCREAAVNVNGAGIVGGSLALWGGCY